MYMYIYLTLYVATEISHWKKKVSQQSERKLGLKPINQPIQCLLH